MTHKDESEIWKRFHVLWGKAHGHPDYDKEDWKKLQALLEKAFPHIGGRDEDDEEGH